MINVGRPAVARARAARPYNGRMPRGVSWLHVLADALLIGAGFWSAWMLRFGSGLIPVELGVIAPGQWMTLGLLSLPVWLLIFALHGLYYARLKQAFASELGSLTHAVAEGLLATILITFIYRGLPDSRLALLLAVALAWLWLSLYRAIVRRLRRRRPRAVVVGDSPLAEYLRRQFAGHATRFDLAAAYANAAEFELGDADAVFCDVHEAGAVMEVLAGSGGRWLPSNQPAEQAGQPQAAAQLNSADGVDASLREAQGRRRAVAATETALYLLPAAAFAGVSALSSATVEGVPTLTVKSAADLAVVRRIKRVVDILAGSVALILTAPLWLFCILGIALTMPGPLFFGHKRLGLFGREFRLLKFRSMVINAEALQVDLEGFDEAYKLKNDPRITPFGRLMRRLSLDELPQLLNILRGELSVVGPRPIVQREVEKYGPWGRLLTTVPPGLTGLWQVSGRSDTTYQQRIDFDLYYINNWSLGLDLLIILRTIPAVLSRKGAY
jgi:exopolysaccharide biosynthesis polyprenyl glycosylphosphotransferase